MRNLIAMANGRRVCVLRPATPELAKRSVELALAAALARDTTASQRIPSQIGEYRFVGYLAQGRDLVVDARGDRVGDSEPGDLYLDEGQAEQMLCLGHPQ